MLRLSTPYCPRQVLSRYREHALQQPWQRLYSDYASLETLKQRPLSASKSRNAVHAAENRASHSLQQPWRRLYSDSTSLKTPKQRPPNARKSRDEVHAAKNRALLMYSTAVIVVAMGASYAAVPLYRIFCAATGFAGTPKVGTGRFEPERLVPIEHAGRIKVHFNADRSEQLPWTFTPQQKFVSVLPGETSLAFYRAKNNSKNDIIGIATYNVTPDRIAPYFSKVECFCFEEQRLLAGEEVDMPLLFFIDKDMLDDPACRNVEDVVLSYTFFRARRNEHGQLEPDAEEDAVQNSLGFGGYENAPKAEIRNSSKETTSSTSTS